MLFYSGNGFCVNKMPCNTGAWKYRLRFEKRMLQYQAVFVQRRVLLGAVLRANCRFLKSACKGLFPITDKAPIFDDLSVSKTHFTDKPTFPSDLSVIF